MLFVLSIFAPLFGCLALFPHHSVPGEDGPLCLDFYDVSDIIDTSPDWPAPELSIPATGFRGATWSSGKPKTWSWGLIDADKLRDLIDSKLGEAADDGGSVEISGGVLVVRKRPEAHRKIQRLLAALRLTIETGPDFLEKIGVRRVLARIRRKIAPVRHTLRIRQRASIQGVEVNTTGVIPVLDPVVGILEGGQIEASGEESGHAPR
jgi:hypothetical protein